MLPVQMGVYAALTQDATLMAMVTGIFDHVPDNSPFPYVAVGDLTEGQFETFARDGKDLTVTLHVWSQYQGFRQAHLVFNRIVEVLDNQPLELTGFTLVSIRHENTQTFTDADGITRHLVGRFRVVVEETP